MNLSCLIKALALSLATTFSLSSCVLPAYVEDGAPPPIGIGYYSALPPAFVGNYYLFSGRYYYGGRYERGPFHYRGRLFDNRYYHHGHYLYGGRHDYHDGPHGPGHHH